MIQIPELTGQEPVTFARPKIGISHIYGVKGKL